MRLIAILLLAAALSSAAVLPDPRPDEIQAIITKFAAKESAFARARENYVFKQITRMHEYDPGRRRIIGKYETNADWTFVAGKRVEKITYAPPMSFQNLILEPEDVQDMRDTLPFVLTTEDLDKYDVRYLGHEQVDEVPCFVFAIKPKKLEPGKRYFSGTAWVDDQELQIVKTYGRAMGIKRNANSQYPKFETYREQVDGKFWFPTYTVSTDTLAFPTGEIPIKLTIKYQDYKQFKSDTTITFGDPVEEAPAKPAPPKPTPPKP